MIRGEHRQNFKGISMSNKSSPFPIRFKYLYYHGKKQEKLPFVTQYRHFPLLALHTVTGKGRTVGVLTGFSSLQLVTTANTVMGTCTTPERQWNSGVARTVKFHLPDGGCCHDTPQLTSGE